jgi:hypothetical protein
MLRQFKQILFAVRVLPELHEHSAVVVLELKQSAPVEQTEIDEFVDLYLRERREGEL